MEITLWNVTLYNLIDESIRMVLFYYMVLTFLQTKRGWKKLALCNLLLLPGYALLAAWLYLKGWFGSPYIGQMLYHTIVNTVAAILIYRFVMKKPGKAFIICSIVSFLSQLIEDMVTIVSPGKFFVLTERGDFILYTVISCLVYPVFVLLAVACLKRLRMPEKISAFTDYRRVQKRMAAVAVFLPVLKQLLYLFAEFLADFMYVATTFLAYALFAGFIVLLYYISTREIELDQMRMKETLMKQQEIYVRNMEMIQQEVHSYSHDFKNIMTGLALQLESGKTEEVKRYLEEVTGRFDQKIGESIRETTQIGNIQIMPLRSLVLTKMTEMQEKGIRCNLEVLYPVEETAMETEDLLRCIGILLDNAMEESIHMEGAMIDVILCQQERQELSVVIGNRTRHEVKAAQIWQNGYSTKGEKRGRGLYSYQRILKKYPEAVTATGWKAGYFRQELRIPGALRSE